MPYHFIMTDTIPSDVVFAVGTTAGMAHYRILFTRPPLLRQCLVAMTGKSGAEVSRLIKSRAVALQNIMHWTLDNGMYRQMDWQPVTDIQYVFQSEDDDPDVGVFNIRVGKHAIFRLDVWAAFNTKWHEDATTTL